MGFLHRSRAWYLVALAYVVTSAALLPVPRATLDVFLRACLASASSLSVLISDGYHNPDLRGSRNVTSEKELFWLRWDYVGISAILTTNFWLWASNIGWTPGLKVGAVLAGLSTAAISRASFTIVPERKGHIFVKLTLAFQFVAVLGYLVSQALASPIKLAAIIYLCYCPGSASLFIYF